MSMSELTLTLRSELRVASWKTSRAPGDVWNGRPQMSRGLSRMALNLGHDEGCGSPMVGTVSNYVYGRRVENQAWGPVWYASAEDRGSSSSGLRSAFISLRVATRRSVNAMVSRSPMS